MGTIMGRAGSTPVEPSDFARYQEGENRKRSPKERNPMLTVHCRCCRPTVTRQPGRSRPKTPAVWQRAAPR